MAVPSSALTKQELTLLLTSASSAIIRIWVSFVTLRVSLKNWVTVNILLPLNRVTATFHYYSSVSWTVSSILLMIK